MRKILFCNLELLVKGFEGYDPVLSRINRDKFLKCMSELISEDENLVCFISRNNQQ